MAIPTSSAIEGEVEKVKNDGAKGISLVIECGFRCPDCLTRFQVAKAVEMEDAKGVTSGSGDE